MPKQRVRVAGEFMTHQTLWRTAEFFLAQGRTPEGSFYPLLAAGVFGFFAFESLLNELLRQVDPDTWRDERAIFSKGEFVGTLGKYRWLAQKFGVEIDASRRPYQCVTELAKARDVLAHAKTEMFDVLVRTNDISTVPRQASILDRYSDLNFVEPALADLLSVSNALVQAVNARLGDIGVGGERGAYDGVDGSWQASIEPSTGGPA